jgi:hypothetical protein
MQILSLLTHIEIFNPVNLVFFALILFCISTAALITNLPLTSWGSEMKFTEKIEKELI